MCNVLCWIVIAHIQLALCGNTQHHGTLPDRCTHYSEWPGSFHFQGLHQVEVPEGLQLTKGNGHD